MVRLRPLSVAVALADEDDALLLLCDEDLFVVLLCVEDPSLVVLVILSFFFFFWLVSLFDFPSRPPPAEAAAVGRGGRLMVTMRALPLPLDRRDGVPDTALVISEGVPCLEERQTSASPPLADSAAEADDDRPAPQTAERARKGGIEE